jgi:hypothetical protein
MNCRYTHAYICSVLVVVALTCAHKLSSSDASFDLSTTQCSSAHLLLLQYAPPSHTVARVLHNALCYAMCAMYMLMVGAAARRVLCSCYESVWPL